MVLSGVQAKSNLACLILLLLSNGLLCRVTLLQLENVEVCL